MYIIDTSNTSMPLLNDFKTIVMANILDVPLFLQSCDIPTGCATTQRVQTNLAHAGALF